MKVKRIGNKNHKMNVLYKAVGSKGLEFKNFEIWPDILNSLITLRKQLLNKGE